MKISYMSDLHLEFGPFEPYTGFSGDILILAGDITTRCNPEHLLWIAELPFDHIIYVFGNHEYYHGSIECVEQETRDFFADIPYVHILQNEWAKIEGVTFHGCTLWTNFYCYNPHSMIYAETSMSDFQIISYDNFSRQFKPYNALIKHEESVKYLRENVRQGDIVITHHAPSLMSINERFKGSPLNPAFVSDLDSLIGDLKPDYWIHGHTHGTFRYDCHDTKVLCNARGYVGHENVHDKYVASRSILVY